MSKTALNILLVLAIMFYISTTIFIVLENLNEYSQAQLVLEGLKYSMLVVIGLNTNRITSKVFKIANMIMPKKGVSH